MKKIPIACQLSEAEIETRREGLLTGLLTQARERVRVDDGFRWRFAPSGEILAATASTIDAERRCCRFLKFVMTIEPDEGSIWLEITGPPGTAEFLDVLCRD
jgi:hypothetical protein